jgi:CxxC motif-containing protein (DUF1111 family)
VRSLAVPVRREVKHHDVLAGKKLFYALGCENCHVSKYTTGQTAAMNALTQVEIHPYSDFLLHDMGQELADNRPDYLAEGSEWRTQPLWGLGLIKAVNGHNYLLHDGRARNITEAILWHGGEGEYAKRKFVNLNRKQREQLLYFLKSL